MERRTARRQLAKQQAEVLRRRLAQQQADAEQALQQKREANRALEECLRRFPWQDDDEIEIFSTSKGCWEVGRVSRVQGPVLTVNYGKGDAERMKKVDLESETVLDSVRAPNDDFEGLSARQRQRDEVLLGQSVAVAPLQQKIDGGSNGARVDRVTFLETRQVSPSIKVCLCISSAHLHTED